MPVIHDGVPKPRLASIGTALGSHRYSQQQLIEGFRELWSGKDREFARVERFHRAVRIESRHLSLPMAAYPLRSFDEATRPRGDIVALENLQHRGVTLAPLVQ